MNKALEKVLAGQADNHILPFFWQHGEDEKTLRTLMGAIHGSGCGAVCVESRPHPDFCGEKWWADMDVILDEARKRNMKVWILDDSHFPTGFANDALKGKPDSLCRQNIFLKEKTFSGKAGLKKLNLRHQGFYRQEREGKLDAFALFGMLKPVARKFNDDSVLSVTARRGEEIVDLTGSLQGDILSWEKPEGDWTLSVAVRSRNTGTRRNYINMTEEDSCQLLLEAVYEPHWQHYAADFGKTIAGFFSDEPELGNGKLYRMDNYMGCSQDLPWGAAMEQAVAEALGEDWHKKLHLLWRDGPEAEQVRSRYMDVLTRRVRSCFSQRVAQWCRDHGVQYIGHIIEDNGQHCRTGSSLGHFFRGLQYQDMAGIDDIGGQVYPQGEDEPKTNFMGQPRNGEFYHYGLAKLAQSAAAIEHRKGGNAMCEIFGNYGWEEGVRLEKYLADHFLVRGINQFVPHAFSGKPFPDPDCPPHFYAHGHNPQYRHFGALMGYMNRVATLTSSGKHRVPVAVLYHGEAEWAQGASAMPFEKPLRRLYDRQIDCHVIPADIFREPEHYRVELGSPLEVNGQRYYAFIVPEAKTLCAAAAEGLAKLLELGLPVFFVSSRPERVAETGQPLPETLAATPCVALEQLAEAVAALNLDTPRLTPACDRIRILHILGDTDLFFLVNEDDKPYKGSLKLPAEGECFCYDPWHNVCLPLEIQDGAVKLELEPLKSRFIVFGPAPALESQTWGGSATELTTWQRSLCSGIDYPAFGQAKAVAVPEDVALEDPKFSGFIRYETNFPGRADDRFFLEITDAGEAVEVFLNGKSLGIQIAPPFRYDLTGALADGENRLAIEVATTLERQCYPMLKGFRKMLARKPASTSGLTGKVFLIRR